MAQSKRRNWRDRSLGMIVGILIMAAIPLGMDAYRMITIHGVVTVEEAIVFDKDSFAVTMYPGETHVETITLSNQSSASLTVTPSVATGVNGLVVTAPNSVTVNGNGSTTVDITIAARTDIVPGVFNVDVGLHR
jgi:hypothetical protein